VNFQVQRSETEKFSKVWNKGGVTILLTPEAIDFATYWANIVLRNFIQMCQEDAKKQVPKPKQIIMEGVN
jgi:hypothetical protein